MRFGLRRIDDSKNQCISMKAFSFNLNLSETVVFKKRKINEDGWYDDGNEKR